MEIFSLLIIYVIRLFAKYYLSSLKHCIFLNFDLYDNKIKIARRTHKSPQIKYLVLKLEAGTSFFTDFCNMHIWNDHDITTKEAI